MNPNEPNLVSEITFDATAKDATVNNSMAEHIVCWQSISIFSVTLVFSFFLKNAAVQLLTEVL